LIIIVLLHPFLVRAGGSGLNVVVVVNQNSPNSVRLGNDYCEKRGVPPQNLFRMTGWTGGVGVWSRAECEANLRDPLLSMLTLSGLTNQVQYVLLSMDIPYRIVEGDSANSTTSFLFYGFKTNAPVAQGIFRLAPFQVFRRIALPSWKRPLSKLSQTRPQPTVSLPSC
jgi:uncharacterized protein (TIGR03790 family)